MDYDEDGALIISGDNETHSESQEQEHQSVRMHTPPLNYDIPSLPQNVQATISGTGCAVLQVCVAFTCNDDFILTNDSSLVRPKCTGKLQNR